MNMCVVRVFQYFQTQVAYATCYVSLTPVPSDKFIRAAESGGVLLCSPSVRLSVLGGLTPGVHLLLSAWDISYCTLREHGKCCVLTAGVNHMSGFSLKLWRHSRCPQGRFKDFENIEKVYDCQLWSQFLLLWRSLFFFLLSLLVSLVSISVCFIGRKSK